jgi:Tfp pilus assembly protein PilX
MKTTVTILSIVLVIVIGIMGLAFLKVNELKTHISTLNDDNTKLTNTNAELQVKANLKSFENTKTLERFLKNSTAIKNADPNGYASESCISLMREARDNGYWLGITAINTSDESVYSAMLKMQHGITDIKWHVFNIAIVGDFDLYLIDSQEVGAYYLLSTIAGDFASYNESPKSSTINLKLH